MRSYSAAVVWHVSALLGSYLLATALDGVLALFALHVLELVDEEQFLLLGWNSISILIPYNEKEGIHCFR